MEMRRWTQLGQVVRPGGVECRREGFILFLERETLEQVGLCSEGAETEEKNLEERRSSMAPGPGGTRSTAWPGRGGWL